MQAGFELLRLTEAALSGTLWLAMVPRYLSMQSSVNARRGSSSVSEAWPAAAGFTSLEKAPGRTKSTLPK